MSRSREQPHYVILPKRGRSAESYGWRMCGEWFVGRGEELDLLRDLLAGVVAGVGGSVLVEGEQGIGKTALLRQALSAAADRCRVVWATADELGQQFPLGLFADCFGKEGRLAATGEQAGLGGDGGSRSRDALSGDPMLAGVERMLALADRLCAASPLVVVAEDLQWASLGSGQSESADGPTRIAVPTSAGMP